MLKPAVWVAVPSLTIFCEPAIWAPETSKVPPAGTVTVPVPAKWPLIRSRSSTVALKAPPRLVLPPSRIRWAMWESPRSSLIVSDLSNMSRVPSASTAPTVNGPPSEVTAVFPEAMQATSLESGTRFRSQFAASFQLPLDGHEVDRAGAGELSLSGGRNDDRADARDRKCDCEGEGASGARACQLGS